MEYCFCVTWHYNGQILWIIKRCTGQNRVTISMQCQNDNVVHVRKSTRPEPRQQKIYSALGLCPHPGRTIKTTINKMNKSSAITKILKN